jgi:hypothetical protein
MVEPWVVGWVLVGGGGGGGGMMGRLSLFDILAWGIRGGGGDTLESTTEYFGLGKWEEGGFGGVIIEIQVVLPMSPSTFKIRQNTRKAPAYRVIPSNVHILPVKRVRTHRKPPISGLSAV